MTCPPLRRRSALLAALASGALGWAALPARAATEPLRLGLAPYLSPAALLAAFRPLREHLEQRLARPVEAATARDFRTLLQAIQAREFDLVLMPAHLARLAQADWGWQAGAATLDVLQVQAVVKEDGPVRAVGDLAGRRAGMLDAFSLTGTLGRRWLVDEHLAGRVEVLTQPSVNSAIHALDLDEVAVVVTSDSQLRALPPGTPRRWRTLARLPEAPGPMLMARPGVAAAELARWREALYSFAPDATRALTAANSPLHAIDAAVLSRLEPHAVLVRQLLTGPR